MGQLALGERAAAPDTPSAGYLSVYALAATSGGLFTKDDGGTVRTIAMEDLANVFTAAQKIDVSSAVALLVEDDGVNDNTLVVDTSTPGVGVGTASPARLFHIATSSRFPIKIESTDAGANPGPIFEFYRNSASPTAADELGELRFSGEDDGGGESVYAILRGVLVNPSAGAEEGALKFLTTSGGDASLVRVTILNTGSIGIGTESPGSLLELNLATEDLEIVDAGSAAATEQDWVEVQIGGVTGYIRIFASK